MPGDLEVLVHRSVSWPFHRHHYLTFQYQIDDPIEMVVLVFPVLQTVCAKGRTGHLMLSEDGGSLRTVLA